MGYSTYLQDPLVYGCPGKYIEDKSAPESTEDFMLLAAKEMMNVHNMMRAFVSYQIKIEEQLVGSDSFRLGEREDTTRAIRHLTDIANAIIDLFIDAYNIGDNVTVQMRVDLDYARMAAAIHREALHHNHVTYKVNWSLVTTKTGIVEPVAHATAETEALKRSVQAFCF